VPILPEQLAGYLTQQPSSTLVFDVRSFVQFSHARVIEAINVSIPNTILKRPTFTMEKVYDAVVEADRTRLKQWASFGVIVFYDQCSMVAPDQCATSYLANKMIQAGYNGSLVYLQGMYIYIEREKESIGGGYVIWGEGRRKEGGNDGRLTGDSSLCIT
jgi:hypothetical protein